MLFGVNTLLVLFVINVIQTQMHFLTHSCNIFSLQVGEYNTQLSAWFPAAQAQGMSLNYPNPTIGYASAYSSNAVTLSSDEIDTLMINEYIPTIKKVS